MANVQTELDTVILAGVHISCMVLNILPTKNVYVLHAVERTTIPNMNIENYYYTECRENIINTLATVTRCLSLYIVYMLLLLLVSLWYVWTCTVHDALRQYIAVFVGKICGGISYYWPLLQSMHCQAARQSICQLVRVWKREYLDKIFEKLKINLLPMVSMAMCTACICM